MLELKKLLLTAIEKHRELPETERGNLLGECDLIMSFLCYNDISAMSRLHRSAAAGTAENFTETGSRVCRSFYPAADPHFWRYNGIALNDGHEPLARLGVVVREGQAFAMSSAVSVKSNRSKFCCIRSLWTDFGITTTPLCMRKRSAVCAAVLPHFAPIREGTRLSAKN